MPGKVYTLFDRLKPKSLKGLMITHFQNRYKLSPSAAETICNDLFVFRNVFSSATRVEGQIIYYAVKLGEPPSKRIRECELLPVRLTIFDPTDIDYRKEHKLHKLVRKVITRITKEAYEQGATLSIEDVSNILHLSEKTIKRHKQLLKKEGIELPFRGEIQDMGPGSSHRVPIVELFLQGYSETEIAQRLNHNLENVEQYIYDFLRCALLFRDGYKESIVCRLTKLSKTCS